MKILPPLMTAAIALLALSAVTTPALAGGNVQWSLSVGNGGPMYAPPPVVVYEQPQFIYGAPPTAFPDRPTHYQYQPPPPVHYVVPGPVIQYQSPPPYYYQHRHHGVRHGHGRGPERSSLRR
ncbi:hypothetical protein RY831_16905 [Noviherbaspirillum sp. CPCC 100848]|uniref:Virulence factor n=1 Tax=Noviherbaspirillum album TaxID=3080276 RepID=A0ABU6JB16_9BURK|nr:hypothetical protein [Noviherbaspirillum sp. CPCC 100848]MEC4720847.1 hypothetical protein [Noviherbaspirillum sp. CPCC 100848]